MEKSVNPDRKDIAKERGKDSSFLPKGKSAPFSGKDGLRSKLASFRGKIEPPIRSQLASLWGKIGPLLRSQIASLRGKIETLLRAILVKIKAWRKSPALQEQVSRLEKETSDLKERLEQIEAENQDLAHRYLELEEENQNLADLTTVCHQLHSSLDFNDILRIITEASINLLGAEIFAIMIVDDKGNELVTVAAEGFEEENLPRISLGKGGGDKIANAEKPYLADNCHRTGTIDDPLMVLPLRIKEHFLGAVIITAFLDPRDGPEKINPQIAELLAGHTATAIFSSKLYSDSKRKLSTLQGFLELLTK